MTNLNPAKLAECKARVEYDHRRNGPIGSHGFRTGNWLVLVDGKPTTVYASVPHQCDLDTQIDRVRLAAARALYAAEA